MLPITVRKRTITEADLDLIQNVVHEHWEKGRTHISEDWPAIYHHPIYLLETFVEKEELLVP
jgi:hypothetical protein